MAAVITARPSSTGRGYEIEVGGNIRRIASKAATSRKLERLVSEWCTAEGRVEVKIYDDAGKLTNHTKYHLTNDRSEIVAETVKNVPSTPRKKRRTAAKTGSATKRKSTGTKRRRVKAKSGTASTAAKPATKKPRRKKKPGSTTAAKRKSTGTKRKSPAKKGAGLARYRKFIKARKAAGDTAAQASAAWKRKAGTSATKKPKRKTGAKRKVGTKTKVKAASKAKSPTKRKSPTKKRAAAKKAPGTKTKRKAAPRKRKAGAALPSPSEAKMAASRSPKRSSGKKTARAGKSRTAKSRSGGGRKASPYNKFVKAHYDSVRHLPPKQRLGALAKKWKASGG